MHEFSIVDSVIATACESAKQAGAERVTLIEIVAGELMQIVKEALDFAFDALSPNTSCEGAQLNVRYIPAKSFCTQCKKEFTHDILHFRCPDCQSPFTEVVSGKEFYIDKIEVEFGDNRFDDQ